ncbi:MAG: methyltransferase domain-containing protein [Candidatus Dojkabacteria bacterium]
MGNPDKLEFDTTNFHKNEKPASMFSEVTASYMLKGREGLSQLIRGGKSFSLTLGEKLKQRFDVSDKSTVINIGDGLGYNSEGLKQTLPGKLINMDLSPNLLNAQKTRNPEISMGQANALQLPLADHSIDLLVNNEMIADLEVTPVNSNQLQIAVNELKRIGVSAEDETAIENILIDLEIISQIGNSNKLTLVKLCQLYLKYNLTIPQNTPEVIYINTGAIEFIEEINRVLKAGGGAWISEFGSDDPNMLSKHVKLPGHYEWSIRFHDLKKVAETLGLKCQIVDLNDFIGIKNDEWCIERVDTSSGEADYMTFEEAHQLNPEKYNENTTYMAISDSLPTDSIPEVLALEKKGVKIRHGDPAISALMDELSRQPHAMIKPTKPILKRLGDFTDHFKILIIEKP